MKKPYFLGLLSVLSSLLGLSSPTARAGNPAIDRLINQTRRPVMAELLAVFKGRFPRRNPMLRYGYERSDEFMQTLQEELPRIIARFERVYPGARYAGLGRDSAHLVDLMDAFYLGRGQSGRAVRINASGGGIHGAELPVLADMLESLGASLDPEARKFVPLVVFDATNFIADGGSQSTRLMQAALDRWRERGGDARGFIQRFNVIATQIYEQNQIAADLDVGRIFALQHLSLERSELRTHQTDTFANKTTFAYTLEWHETFGPLERNPETGIIEGRLPVEKVSRYLPKGYTVAGRNEHRLAILGELYDALIQTSRPEFQQKVAQEAKALGYNLSRTQVVRIPDFNAITLAQYVKYRLQESRKSLNAAIQALRPHPAGYYVFAGSQLTYWLGNVEAIMQGEAALLLLAKLPSLREKKLVNALDTQHIITHILARMKHATPGDARRVAQILDQDPSLRSLFETRAKRARKGDARGASAGMSRLLELGILGGLAGPDSADCAPALLGDAA